VSKKKNNIRLWKSRESFTIRITRGNQIEGGFGFMKIGEVIRKYRKEKQLTQEELAEYLGVTSSAVNKWENGYSLPDIALLSPIARVFGISTDTLLSYKEELTDLEIRRIMDELMEKSRTMEYDGVFAWGMGVLREYPNCDKLAATMLPALDGCRIMLMASDPGQYEEGIMKAYQRLLKSENPDYVKIAATFMFYNYMNHQKYEEAEKILSRLSEKDQNYKQMQALLYRRQGQKKEAYRIYEEQILAGYEKVSGAFMGILAMATEDKDAARCDMIMEKQEQLAHLLEMGRYQEICMQLAPALESGDKEKALFMLKEAVHGIQDMLDYQKSMLYEHLEFVQKDGKNSAFLMKQSLLHDEITGFLQGDPEFEEIMRELKELAGEKSLTNIPTV